MDQLEKNVDVSVIICTWNRAERLATTLESLSAQDCSCLVEVIVVDNNSSDDTKEVVEALSESWRLGSLVYEYVGRQGKQFALNHGIEKARGDVIAFTDDDVLLDEGWLSSIFKVFGATDAELIGGRTLEDWRGLKRPAWYDSRMGAVFGAVDLGDHPIRNPGSQYAPAGANMAARRSLFSRVGLFSEVHFRHEDQEFGDRCTELGTVILYEPAMKVYAPVDERCLNKRYFRRWYFKAGILLELTDGGWTKLTSILPIWLYRQLFVDTVKTFFAYLTFSRDRNFFCELRCWRNFGSVSSFLVYFFNKKGFMHWVERKSQKVNNIC